MHANVTYNLSVADPTPPDPHWNSKIPGLLRLWWHGESFSIGGSSDDLLAWLDMTRQAVVDAIAARDAGSAPSTSAVASSPDPSPSAGEAPAGGGATGVAEAGHSPPFSLQGPSATPLS